MLKRLVLVAVVVVLVAPGVSWAGTLQFFEASAGAGNTLAVGLGAASLDLDYDVRTAEDVGIFAFNELEIVATGGISLTSFTCQAAECQNNFEPDLNRLRVSGGKAAGEGPGTVNFGGDGSAGLLNFGLLGITVVGAGTVEIIAGGYLDGGFGPQLISPFVLAQHVVETPEPGSLVLLGAGLAGLAFLRRRAA